MLTQLHLWQLCLTLTGGSAPTRAASLSPELRERCRDAMRAAETHPSQLQRSVAAAVSAVRAGFEQEAIEEQTGYSLDLALCASCIAIEVDGPFHFMRDPLGKLWPSGPTRLKQRLLRAAGWHLINVPFYEWNALNGREEQRAYVERWLRDAL